ncbi:MAG: hypothetical protein RSD40_06065, partial [Bacilli bacterium]
LNSLQSLTISSMMSNKSMSFLFFLLIRFVKFEALFCLSFIIHCASAKETIIGCATILESNEEAFVLIGDQIEWKKSYDIEYFIFSSSSLTNLQIKGLFDLFFSSVKAKIYLLSLYLLVYFQVFMP